jgi:Glycosyltransferase
MKVLLYTEGIKHISKSGLGKSLKHQMKALEENDVEYTLDKKDDYDIVHINFYGPNSYRLAKKAKKQGKKIVYHAHSTEEDFRNSFIGSNLVSPLFKKWIIKCYSLADHIITPTPYSKKLLKGYGIDVPITAISNGIDMSFYEKNENYAETFRKAYGYRKTDKIIMAIGLYIERKGIIDFVELAKRMPEYKFIWFGESPLYASPKKVREAVKTKLPNLNFPGYVDPTIIRGALSGASLYIFPTYEETEGMPVLEALTNKQNLIVRDIPVFDGWLKDGVNCHKAKDTDEFELKIKQIIKGEHKDTTEEGYKVAHRKNIKNVGKNMKKIYEELLKETKE